VANTIVFIADRSAESIWSWWVRNLAVYCCRLYEDYPAWIQTVWTGDYVPFSPESCTAS